MRNRMLQLRRPPLFLIVMALALAVFPIGARAEGTDLMVEGEAGGYEYEGSVLRFIAPGSYTVTGTTTTDRIVVTGGTTDNPVNITLDNVSIDATSNDDACAFGLESGATVRLTLSGTNVLYSGGLHAGLEVPDGASLAVYGSDSGSSLRAQSRMYSAGAGIGGGYGQAAGDITIYGGTIEATSGHGAGIGGGHGGNGGTITIVGGEITATTLWGAGIGGGNEGDGGTIAIEGGTITAASFYGAGVGGGFRGNGGTITINDGTVTAKAPSTSPQPTDMSKIGAAIGGGCGGAGGNITISGGIVTAIASEYNAAIGDGNTANTDVGLTVTISGGEIVAESCPRICRSSVQ